MRLPRGSSGRELAKRLERFGYHVTRQRGSHMRLTTQTPSEHHITVPNHDPIRVGTLRAILAAVAEHTGRTRDEVTEQLFGPG